MSLTIVKLVKNKKVKMDKELIYIVVPKKYDEIVVPPFTAMCLSKQLKKNNYTVKVLHINENEIEHYVTEIVKEKPLFVGFSVFTGIYNLYAAEMSKKLKAKDQNLTIVWGGVHPSIMPNQCLQEEYIDIVVIREAEVTVIELANALKNGTQIDNIQGIGIKKDGKIIVNKNRDFIKDLDNYKMDFECVDLNKYIVKSNQIIDGKVLPVRSIGYYGSRGCVFDCKFCYNLQYNDRKWRAFSAELVINDVKHLHEKYGVNDVMFWDDHFFINRARALEILKALNELGIRGTGSDIRFDSYDDKYLNELKKTGANYFLIGAESGCDRLLKLIRKGFDTKFMLEKIKLLEKYDIAAQYSFILGLPTETKEEFYQTIDFMYKIHKIHKKASFTVGIYMPYPGSELFNLAVKLGYVPPKNTSDWNELDRWRNTVNLPWINPKMCLNVRTLFAMLSWNFGPLFNKWIQYRIEKKILNLSIDLKFLIFYYNVVLNYKYEYLNLAFRKTLSNIKNPIITIFKSQATQ